MSSKKDVARVAPTELSLIPPGAFFIVCDMNTMQAMGPFDKADEAKYRAAELAAGARGPKPVGVFSYVGGVTSAHRPLFWTDAQ